MDGITQAMMNLIGSEVCGAKFNPELYAALSGEEKAALYRLSKKHDLAHIVGNALLNADLLSEGKLKEAYQKEVYTAVFRYETLAYELEELRRVFNEAKIPFIPLKGSVIRRFYPEPWMRTSCDIDILVHEEDLDRAVNVLVQTKGFKQEGRKNFHDVSLYSPSGIHLELHFNIKETIEKLDAVLDTAWQHAAKKEGSEYEYEFSDEFLLFHLYAHASYHFVGGGCGVRPFVDFYILKRNLHTDNEKLNDLLERAGIKFFAKKAEELSEVWFGGRPHDDITKEAEEFVLSGGVYGNAFNHAAVKQAEKGKSAHLRSRIWLPYKNLVILYPSLKGKRILQPLYEIRRWCKLFKKSTFKKSVTELKTNASVKQEEVIKTQKLLSDLRLL